MEQNQIIYNNALSFMNECVEKLNNVSIYLDAWVEIVEPPKKKT